MNYGKPIRKPYRWGNTDTLSVSEFPHLGHVFSLPEIFQIGQASQFFNTSNYRFGGILVLSFSEIDPCQILVIELWLKHDRLPFYVTRLPRVTGTPKPNNSRVTRSPIFAPMGRLVIFLLHQASIKGDRPGKWAAAGAT